MPELRIVLQKRTDGGAVLRCIRADGSVTWQKQEGPRASFFPRHDLTHFAVETTLGIRRAFYGLIAEGWDIVATEVRARAVRCHPTPWPPSTWWACLTSNGPAWPTG